MKLVNVYITEVQYTLVVLLYLERPLKSITQHEYKQNFLVSMEAFFFFV